MSSSTNNYGRCDGVGVHAGLGVMVERNQGPISDDSSDALVPGVVGVDDEVLNGGGIHHDDVGLRKDLGEEGGCEESGVLDDDEVAFVLVGDAELSKEVVGGLADDLRMTNKVAYYACQRTERTMGVISWPPSHAPPPGATFASRIVIFN